MGSRLQSPSQLAQRWTARTPGPARLGAGLGADPYANYVLVRLLDFFADTSPWSRRLWRVGSVLALKEACEAGDWTRQGALSDGAVRAYAADLKRDVLKDPGVDVLIKDADGDESRFISKLRAFLGSGLAPDSMERRQLSQILPAVEDGYLRRWQRAVAQVEKPRGAKKTARDQWASRSRSLSPESVAVAVASHLLDNGHSSGKLHRWAKQLGDNADATLHDLLESACGLAERRDEAFDVLVPFRAIGEVFRTPADATFVPPDHVARLLAPYKPKRATDAANAEWPIRQNGGLRYRVAAKDEVAAARQVGRAVEKVHTRTLYLQGTGPAFDPVGRVWIVGRPESLPLRPPGRGVYVRSLRDRAEFDFARWPARLDDALEMAAPLDRSGSAPAASGAWAAIESLLYVASGDKDGHHIAATRLAAIIVCSLPRRELSVLSHRHKPDAGRRDRLRAALDASHTMRHRCEAVATALRRGWHICVEADDVAAARRMAAVVNDPRQELADRRHNVEAALVRLYRHRNIAVHGGTTAAVAFDATLRTATPLIGAGLDRLVHAAAKWRIDAVTLAARAENSLALVGHPNGPTVTGLLDWP